MADSSAPPAEVTETPAFKAWFAGSKIVTPGGAPLRLYHTTCGPDFDTFKGDSKGLIYFSPRPNNDPVGSRFNYGHRSIPVYIKARNPWDFRTPQDVEAVLARLYSTGTTNAAMSDAMDLDNFEVSFRLGMWYAVESQPVAQAMRELGFDAVWICEGDDVNLAVFSSDQIKSAIGNSGAFDPNDTRITASARTAGEDPIRHRVTVQGFPVAIEYPAGSTKLGEDETGKKWARVYLLDYGFIEGGPLGGDGEVIDVYVGPSHDALQVYVVNQLKQDGSFDETKCMLGFTSLEAAKRGYLMHYPADWENDRVGSIKTMGVAEFRKWLGGPGVAKAARADQWGSPAFKAWFGASKAVDAQGNPQRFYHGTSKDKNFDKFNEGMRGIWFTKDQGEASAYARDNDSQNLKYNVETRRYDHINDQPRVIPVYLKMLNPYVMTPEEIERFTHTQNYAGFQRDLGNKVRAQGYDSIIYPDGSHVVFSANQVKSAIGNSGAFDPQNKRITAAPQDNPNFRKWFDGSRLVDEHGAPKTLYHGTDKQFDAFDPNYGELGSHVGPIEQANNVAGDRGVGCRVIPVHVALRNPLRLEDHDAWQDMDTWSQLVKLGLATEEQAQLDNLSDMYCQQRGEYIRNYLLGLGYDGIVYLNRQEGIPKENLRALNSSGPYSIFSMPDTQFKQGAPMAQDSYIAFKPEQLKSAIGNNGAYSPEDARLTASKTALLFAPDRGSRSEVLMTVDVAKVEEQWSGDSNFYVGPGGSGAAIGDRYNQFKAWLAEHPNTPIGAPSLGYYKGRGIMFGNGRHRWAVLRDLGAKRIAVTVDRGSVKEFERLFGGQVVPGPVAHAADEVSKEAVAALARQPELVKASLEAIVAAAPTWQRCSEDWSKAQRAQVLKHACLAVDDFLAQGRR